jgi:hypothetical protein
MTEPAVVDCMGKTFKVGDIIVYPVRRGSTMTLKKATVCEVPGHGCTIKQGVVCLNDRGRRVIVERPERCAVVSNYEERNRAKL